MKVDESFIGQLRRAQERIDAAVVERVSLGAEAMQEEFN